MAAIRIFDNGGNPTESLEVSALIEKKESSSRTFALVIRSLLQNWRQGTVGCKGRSDVSFSNRKPWRQKGTGRARAGTPRSPLFRGGGVTFGPQARTRTLAVNAAQRSLVFNNLLFSALERDGINCVDFNVMEKISTKQAAQMLKSLNLHDKNVVLFVPFGDEKTFLSFCNIPSVRILSFDEPNAYDLSRASHWVFLKKDIDLFKEMIARWN
jgi:large subunit ribosomal protein L4